MQPNSRPPSRYSTWCVAKRCIAIIWEFRPSYIVMQTFFGVYSALFVYLGFRMTGYFLDTITSGTILRLSERGFLVPFLGYIASVYLFRVINNLKDLEVYDFDRRSSQHLNNLLIKQRSQLELAQLDNPEIANISTKANENIGKVSDYIRILNDFGGRIYGIITSLVVVLPWSLLVAVINLVTMLPEFYVSKKVQLSRFGVYDKNTVTRRKYNSYRGYLANTQQIREVKIRNIAHYLLETSRAIINVIHDEAQVVDRQKFRMRVWSILSMVTGFSISIYFVYNNLLAGAITVGFATLIAGQINSLRENIGQGFFLYNNLETQSLYMQDIFKFLDIQPQLLDGPRTLPTPIESIVFKNITFSYPESNKHALHNISLTIPHGSKVAIVGENGAGKSTLTKLLLRYYDPTSGAIKINNTPLPEFKREDWYSRISYMPQDYNKYPFELREVITLGEPAEQFDQARYDLALHISQVDKLIDSLPLGDKTILSPQFEGGIELSVGQSQKVAIARVLYRKSDLLILDEPTSAIDAITELHIFNSIEKLPDTQTVILISHRFNTVKNADIIVVLEHGTIVESGTHEQLMNNRNRYYEMYTAQKDSYE